MAGEDDTIRPLRQGKRLFFLVHHLVDRDELIVSIYTNSSTGDTQIGWFLIWPDVVRHGNLSLSVNTHLNAQGFGIQYEICREVGSFSSRSQSYGFDIYNASVVNFYNATGSLARLKTKIFYSTLKNAVAVNSKVVGLAPGTPFSSTIFLHGDTEAHS
jgi:hypothetical protein